MNLKESVANTLQVLDKKEYTNANRAIVSIKNETDNCIQNTQLYTSEALDKLIEEIKVEANYNTHIELWLSSSVQAIIDLSKQYAAEKIMCLNFASAKNPGGGFINGANAQEESLARASALYLSQLNATEYYNIHKNMKSCVYTDTMIFSPNVPVFKTDDGIMLNEVITCNFITSAAVNTGVVKKAEPHKLPDIEMLMRKRVEKVFALAYAHQMEILILGAWGCGVFQNNPIMIAQLFKEQLVGKYKNAFKKVVFAIYSEKHNYHEFKEVLQDVIN